VQLLRLRPAFEGCDVTYATVSRGYEPEVEGARFRPIIDSNRDTKLKLLLSFFNIAWTIIRVWPDTIITTGAAPGFFAIFIGKLLGKKTIWVDSIANAEELSMSGQKAGKYATHWLTQWEHLAKPDGPHCFGNVLGDASEDGGPKSEVRSRISEVGTQAPDNQPRSSIPSSHSSDLSLPTTDLVLKPSDLSPQTSDLGNQPSETEQPTPIRNPQSAISKKNPKPSRIFVTVGTDQHFNRMVKIIDHWAATNPAVEIFAQIGETDWRPAHIDFTHFLTPAEFVEQIKSASLIVGHAGMGTILTALKHQRPVLVMPKRASLGEHRNEHQLATAKHLAALGKVKVSLNEAELMAALDNLNGITANSSVGPFASNSLTIKLSSFIRSR